MNKKVYIFKIKDEKKLNDLNVEFYRKTDTLTIDTVIYNGNLAMSIWKSSPKPEATTQLKERIKVLESMFKEYKVKPIKKIVII